MGPPVGQALEFLSQVLSQRGPQAVPYAENAKWTIREHMSDLLKMFPALTMSASEFHTNDGRVLNLLKAQGTVPIHYQGVKYNIPVVIWLPERYPSAAPLIYVTPTPNMVIKHGHSCVDGSGQVRTPCVARWLAPASDLSAAVQEMCMVFGAEPPLYSRPAGYTPPPPAAGQAHMAANLAAAAAAAAQQQQQQQQQYPPVGYGAAPGPSSAAASGGSASAAAAAAGGGAGSPSRAARPPAAAAAADLEDAFAPLAARAAAARLAAGLDAFNREAAREMDGLLEARRALLAREAELQRTVGAMQRERAGTEGAVADLGARVRALEAWLDANEWKAAALAGGGGSSGKRGGGGAAAAAQQPAPALDADAAAAALAALDVGRLVVPADDLCRQALAAHADDLAAEDALTVLDRALRGGALAVDAYIRQCRAVARRQFFARARGLKVAAEQHAAAARRGAAAAQQQQQQQQQQYQQQPRGGAGYPMVQGDGWGGPSPIAHALSMRR